MERSLPWPECLKPPWGISATMGMCVLIQTHPKSSRRLTRMAIEDIGLADPRAQSRALEAWDIYERLGSPEGELAFAQLVLYLASTAKSNAGYAAFNQAKADVRESGTEEVPLHLRNAPTKLMKELGYGHAYRYAHDEPEAYAAGEHYLPDDLADQDWPGVPVTDGVFAWRRGPALSWRRTTCWWSSGDDGLSRAHAAGMARGGPEGAEGSAEARPAAAAVGRRPRGARSHPRRRTAR